MDLNQAWLHHLNIQYRKLLVFDKSLRGVNSLASDYPFGYVFICGQCSYSVLSGSAFVTHWFDRCNSQMTIYYTNHITASCISYG